MTDGKAWVTLATNDSYALGAVVLANSLKRVSTTGKLVVMITPGVSAPMRGVLDSTFDVVTEVNVLDSEDAANLALLTRPELGITFTKLHCWRLTQYEKCVFLDADTLVLQNCDELFNREEFSAAPDSGWPDCFNSGVFVFQPNLDTYEKLLQFAVEQGSFDGGDQGLLNLYFSDWSTSDIAKHLPFIYNMVATATYSYLPAYRVFGHNVKIAHFIGPSKPWLQFFDSATGQVRPEPGQEHLQELLQAWWDIFRKDVHPKLTPDMKGLAGAYANISFEGAKSCEQLQFEDAMRKNAWEQGRMDYLGKDSFDNIMKKIQNSLAQASLNQKGRAKSPSPAKAVPKARSKSPSPPKTQPTDAAAAEPAQAPPAPQREATPVASDAAPPPTVEAVSPPVEEPVAAVESQQQQQQAAPTQESQQAPQPKQKTPEVESAPAPTQAAPVAEVKPEPVAQAAPVQQQKQQQKKQPTPPPTQQQKKPTPPPEPKPKKATPPPEPQQQKKATPPPEPQQKKVTPPPEPQQKKVTPPPEPKVQQQQQQQSQKKPTPPPEQQQQQKKVTPPPEPKVQQQQKKPTPPPEPKQKKATPPPEPKAAPAAAKPPQKTAEELEEEQLALDRQAIEKKLAEQKLVAEQKLEEEKRRAAETAAAQQQPQAPPRGKGKGKK